MPTIGLLGPYSSRNFGDTAIQMAVIDGLLRQDPALEFIGICPDPADTMRSLSIPAFPLEGNRREVLAEGDDADMDISARTTSPSGSSGRLGSLIQRIRCWRNIWRCTASLDLLLICGSGQLDDYWGGPWRHPYALYVWTLAARLRGVPVAVFGIGLDDLSSRIGRMLALAAIRRACHCAVRDAGTQQFLERHAAGGRSHVCPDPAFSLRRFSSQSIPGPRARPVVVVCLISRRAWLRQTTEAYVAYRDVMRAVCLELLQRGVVLRLSNSQTNLDGPLVAEFAAELMRATGTAECIETAEAASVEQYLQACRTADLVVASRLHAVILALVGGAPVVAVSYGRKVRQLMEEIGSAAQCADLVGLRAQPLLGMILEGIEANARHRDRVTSRLGELRAQLESEFPAIVRLANRSV